MTKRPPPISVRLFTAGALRLADCQRVPVDQRPQFVDTVVKCFGGALSQQFAGETVRLWAPRTPGHERVARRLRIAAALRMGDPPSVIAKREGVSTETVRKIKAQKNPP